VFGLMSLFAKSRQKFTLTLKLLFHDKMSRKRAMAAKKAKTKQTFMRTKSKFVNSRAVEVGIVERMKSRSTSTQ